MKKQIKKALSLVISTAMILSSLAIPSIASANGFTPLVTGDNVLNEWKFDFGADSNAEAGYTAVTPDMNVIATGTYGFLGNDGNGHRLTDRYDGFRMTEGSNITLEAGGGTGLNDAIGATALMHNGKNWKDEGNMGMGEVPTRFGLKVPNNTYYRVRATVTGLDQSKDANVSLYTERLHPIITEHNVPAGSTYTVDFSVDIQTIYFEKSDPKGNFADDMLNVSVLGDNAAIASLEIQQVTPGKTLWVLGDSTVTDGAASVPFFPLQNYSGVGQSLSKYISPEIAVSNHGEGGLNANDNSHFNNVKNNIKAGDYMYVEYGHNHKDDGTAGYLAALPKYYTAAHDKGANLLVVSPMERHQSSQYDSATNTWSASLGGFATVGKQYVQDKITEGATDVAYVELVQPCLDWFTSLTGANNNSASIVNFYYQTAKGGGTDATHPNQAGTDKIASLFFEDAQKTIDAGTPVQSTVLSGLLANKTNRTPVAVSSAITSLGSAPNTAWPLTPIASSFAFPIIIKEIGTDENGYYTSMTVQVQDTISTYGRGIIAVYNADGTLAGTSLSLGQIDNTTGTGSQTVYFDGTLKLNEGQTMKAFVWACDTSDNMTLQMVPFSTEYVPSDIDSYLIKGENGNVETFEYYGLAADASIAGYGSWTNTGSGETRLSQYKVDADNNPYLHVEGDGVKAGASGQGSFFLSRVFDKDADGNAVKLISSGKYLIETEIKFNSASGVSTIGFAKGVSSSATFAEYMAGFKFGSDGSVTFGDGYTTAGGTLNQGSWSSVRYILDLDNGMATISVAGAPEVTAPIAGYRTFNVVPNPSELNGFAIDAGKVGTNFDVRNLKIAKLKDVELPQKALTVAVHEDCADKGTVTGTITATQNTTVSISATANAGNVFEKWVNADTGADFSFSKDLDVRLFDNINLKAKFVVEVIDPINYLYKQDFTQLNDQAGLVAHGWAVNGGTMSIDTDSANTDIIKYAKHVPSSTSGNRTTSFVLPAAVKVGGPVVLNFDYKFTPGADRTSQLAILNDGISSPSNAEASGAGVIYALNFATNNNPNFTLYANSTAGVVSTGLVNNTWYKVRSTIDFTTKMAHVKVMSFDEATTIIDQTVAIDQSATNLGRIHLCSGRGSATAFGLDNIKVYVGETVSAPAAPTASPTAEPTTTPSPTVEPSPTETPEPTATPTPAATYTTRWDFGKVNGALDFDLTGEGATTTYDGTGDAPGVVTMNIDATNGKLSNSGRADQWCQMNSGAKLTIPVTDGSVVIVKGFPGWMYSINGVAYTADNTDQTYTYSGASGTVDIISTGGMAYISYVKLTSTYQGAGAATPSPTAGPTGTPEPTEPTPSPTVAPLYYNNFNDETTDATATNWVVVTGDRMIATFVDDVDNVGNKYLRLNNTVTSNNGTNGTGTILDTDAAGAVEVSFDMRLATRAADQSGSFELRSASNATIAKIIFNTTGNYTINGVATTSVPTNTEWATLVAKMNFVSKTVSISLKSKDGATTYFTADNIEFVDATAVGFSKLYYANGRYQSDLNIDNLLVKAIDFEDIAPLVKTITVSPTTITVTQGNDQQFTSVITGVNGCDTLGALVSLNTAITWTVTDALGNLALSTIDSNGKLTVDASETETTLVVRATSAYDSTKYAEATVTVMSSNVSEATLKVVYTTDGTEAGKVSEKDVTFTATKYVGETATLDASFKNAVKINDTVKTNMYRVYTYASGFPTADVSLSAETNTVYLTVTDAGDFYAYEDFEAGTQDGFNVSGTTNIVNGATGQGKVLRLRSTNSTWTATNWTTNEAQAITAAKTKMEFDMHYGYLDKKSNNWALKNSANEDIVYVGYDSKACTIISVKIAGVEQLATGTTLAGYQDGNDYTANNAANKTHVTVVVDYATNEATITLLRVKPDSTIVTNTYTVSIATLTAQDVAKWVQTNDMNNDTRCSTVDNFKVTDETVVDPNATPNPTASPTASPTAEPTPEPTAEPTPAPTASPTASPTAAPTYYIDVTGIGNAGHIRSYLLAPSTAYASSGQTVSVSGFILDSGYEITKMTYTWDGNTGEPIEITPVNGTYSFTMLDRIVRVSAVTALIPVPTVAPTFTTTYVSVADPDTNFSTSGTLLANQARITGGALVDATAGSGKATIITVDASGAIGKIRSAAINFTATCTDAGKNSQILIAKYDEPIDTATATWNTVTATTGASQLSGDLGYGPDSGIACSKDITDLLRADADGKMSFAIYTFTARGQAITNLAVNFNVAETDIARVSATVNKVLQGESTPYDTATTSDLWSGDSFKATYQTSYEEIDNSNVKWLYTYAGTAGDDTITLTDSSASNVVNLVYTRVAYQPVNLTTKIDGVSKEGVVIKVNGTPTGGRAITELTLTTDADGKATTVLLPGSYNYAIIASNDYKAIEATDFTVVNEIFNQDISLEANNAAPATLTVVYSTDGTLAGKVAEKNVTFDADKFVGDVVTLDALYKATVKVADTVDASLSSIYTYASGFPTADITLDSEANTVILTVADQGKYSYYEDYSSYAPTGDAKPYALATLNSNNTVARLLETCGGKNSVYNIYLNNAGGGRAQTITYNTEGLGAGKSMKYETMIRMGASNSAGLSGTYRLQSSTGVEIFTIAHATGDSATPFNITIGGVAINSTSAVTNSSTQDLNPSVSARKTSGWLKISVEIDFTATTDNVKVTISDEATDMLVFEATGTTTATNISKMYIDWGKGYFATAIDYTSISETSSAPKYAIATQLSNPQGGSIDTNGITEAAPGDIVTFRVIPNVGYVESATGPQVMDGNTTRFITYTSTGNPGEYSFVMPDDASGVLIYAIIDQLL